MVVRVLSVASYPLSPETSQHILKPAFSLSTAMSKKRFDFKVNKILSSMFNIISN